MSAPPTNVALVGFMASGKSAVGRCLSGAVGWELLDTDAMLEESEGVPVAELFAVRGEGAFRDVEAAALERALSGVHRVIATGGGTVLVAASRRLLRERSRVVWLRISRACVLARLSRRGREKRPLLRSGERDELSRRVAALLEEREPLYREAAHWEVIVDGRRSAQIAADIRRALWPSPGRR